MQGPNLRDAPEQNARMVILMCLIVKALGSRVLLGDLWVVVCGDVIRKASAIACGRVPTSPRIIPHVPTSRRRKSGEYRRLGAQRIRVAGMGLGVRVYLDQPSYPCTYNLVIIIFRGSIKEVGYRIHRIP